MCESGSLPESIGNLTNLEILSTIDNDDLNGPIPKSIKNLTNLKKNNYKK